MSGLRRWLVGGMVLVLLGVGVFIFAFWHYMERPETIEKIRSTASEIAGGAVHFSDLDFMPLRGAVVEEVRIYAGAREEPGKEFLTMENLRLDYRPWRLLLRALDLRRVQINTPYLVLRQRPDGTWQVPHFNPSRWQDALTYQGGLLRFSLLLNDLVLTDGALDILDEQGSSLLSAGGIAVTGSLDIGPATRQAKGKLSINELKWGGLWRISRLASVLHVRDGILFLPDLNAACHGGQIRGDVRMDLTTPAVPFTTQMRLQGVRIDHLLDEFRARSGLVTGLLDARGRFEGSLTSPTLIQGTGEFEIQGARVLLLGGVTPLDRLLDLPELKAHTFPSLSGNFKVAEEKLTFYNLEAASRDLQVTAAGSLGFNRQLDLDVSLAISSTVADKIPESSRKRLTPRSDGFWTTTFKITGTLDQPESNLAEKLGLTVPIRLP